MTTKTQVRKPQALYVSALSAADTYDKAHPEAKLVRAAEIAEQRRYGRHLGGPIHVSWTPGQCQITDIYGRWLAKHGAKSGVYIHTSTPDKI